MLCPKCNTEIPENGVCPVCAAAEAENVGVNTAEPQATPVNETIDPTLPTKPVKKGTYLKKYASKKAKVCAWCSRILALIAAVWLIAGAFLSLNLSMNDIPMYSLLLKEKLTFENIDDINRDLEDVLETKASTLSEEQIKIAEKSIKLGDALVKNPSVSNLLAYIEIAPDLDEAFRYSPYIQLYGFEDLEALAPVLKAAMVIIVGYSLFPMIFALIAAFTNGTPWAIVAICLDLLAGIAFIGIWHWAILAVLLVGAIIFNVNLGKELKSFNKAIKERMATQA